MSLPQSRNLEIYKGDTYSFTFRLRQKTATGMAGDYVDLTGCTAKAQIRPNEDSTQVIAEFTAQIPDQTVLSNRGKVELSLTHEQTAAVTVTGGVWDVQITFPDGVVKTYLKGMVTFGKDVTRV